MKFISLILTYLLFINTALSGLPPTSLKGQEGTKATTFNFEVPNNQATKTATGGLIETGNKNRIVNPGFEHSTYFTGWSSSVTGTASITVGVDTTSPMEGKKSLTIQCSGGGSGGTCTVYQDFTTAIALPAIAYATLDSDSLTGVKLNARVNGASSTSGNLDTLNPDVVKAGVFNMGTTSSGISIEITVAAAQVINVEADEMSAGAQGLAAKLEACTDSYECTDSFEADSSGAGVITKENIEWVTGNASISGTSVFAITLKTGLFTTAPSCRATGMGNNVLATVTSVTTTTLTITTQAAADASLVALPFSFECSKVGADYIGKTAKAVASDQNLRTPGIVKGIRFGASITSGGVVSGNEGGIITTASCATGVWTVNMTGLSAAPSRCFVQITDGANNYLSTRSVTKTQTVLNFTTVNSGATALCASNVDVECSGITP